MELQYLVEGLLFGLFLSVSMGPIFVALTITSIEKGLAPGLTVGSGVWSSDVVYIAVLFLFINTIKDTITSATFNFYLGIIGGLILLIYGLSLVFYKGKLDYSSGGFSAKNYLGFWLRGFLVNTLNPFTPIFWIGVIATSVIGRQLSNSDTTLFLSSIMFMIISSDIIKVGLASYIREKLTNKHFMLITTISGLVMVGMGLYVAGKELVKYL